MAKRKKTKNAAEKPVSNGLGTALGFTDSFGGFPQNQGFPGSQQISNVNTGFVNLRWYLVSNFRQFLSQMYVELGLVRTIVDVPIDDGLRGGITLKSKQLSEEQIEELQISIDRDDDLHVAGQAAKWNRLFGGAGILILTDQDPEAPLELGQIGPDSKLEFRAVDMWELFWDKQNDEGYDPAIQSQDFEFYNYYGEQVHKSRVMRLKGIDAPSFIRPRLRGWGFSVVECLIRGLNQYLKATDLTFEVLDEFKVDIYKIKNLVNTLMSPNGEEQIRRRVNMANWQKNYQNALTMDSEDDWDHKQLSFTGLAEVMKEIRMQIASEMRMPLTKIFGISASGFNSGEDDIEVYNSMVESQVRNKLKYDLLRIAEIKCQKLFSFIPDDLSLTFKPLRVMSSEQEEVVKTSKFARLLQSLQVAAITTEQFLDAANKGDLFDIKIDPMDLVSPETGDVADDTDSNPGEKTDVDDPGANRADTRKPRLSSGDRGAISKEPPAPKSADAPEVKAKAGGEPKDVKSRNSAEFDKASYEADGGDSWIDPRRKEFFSNPGNVDEALWSKAKDASMKALGEIRWQFVTWFYKKQGGKFH